MEIFGIGLPELLVIAVVAVIVMGPDRLPEAARSIGKAVYDFRKAIEPARTAWDDVQREFTSTLDLQGQPSTSKSTVAATTTNLAPKPAGNPWKVHPIAEGLSEEEREHFFATGEIPVWKLNQLAEMEKTHRNGHAETANGVELAVLDYPMPHSEVAYQPAPPFAELEELDYPQPGNVIKEEETEA